MRSEETIHASVASHALCGCLEITAEVSASSSPSETLGWKRSCTSWCFLLEVGYTEDVWKESCFGSWCLARVFGHVWLRQMLRHAAKGEGIPQLLGTWTAVKILSRLTWAAIIMRDHLCQWKVQFRQTFSFSEIVMPQQRYLVRVVWKFQQWITDKPHRPELHLVT